MKVLKFGGTSVGNPERIKNVAKLIIEREPGCKIVVLSAMAGTTNTLVDITDYLYKGNVPGAQETLNALEMKYQTVMNELYSNQLCRQEAEQTINRSFAWMRSIMEGDFNVVEEKEILAQGEIMSTALMMAYLKEIGEEAIHLPALDYMRTNEQNEPDMRFITKQLLRHLELSGECGIFITEGYICRNSNGDIDNLRRGGSDYSASLVGAVTGAEEIQIWTDIDGMHNNDPRFVDNTRPVKELNFEEAAELAYFGAKILHPNCVLPAKLNNIPVRLLNTLDPSAEGTLIYNFPPDGKVKAVAAKDSITAIKIKSGRMLLAYGFLHKVFETFDRHHTPIDMIATSEVGVTVTIDDESHLADIVDDLRKFGTVSVDSNMVIICVVGDLEWHNCGLESTAIKALGKIPVRMISYGGSNFNISMVINQEHKIEALRRLSECLFD